MDPSASAGRSVRVGGLDLDLESGELTHDGARVRLQVQSLELLKALLERPGAMVTREELRRRLWPDDTFVDFDHGLNAAVRRLREVLSDSADAPRFVETIPRKGYRLIAPVEEPPAAAVDVVVPGLEPTGPASGGAPAGRPPLRAWWVALAGAAAGVVVAWAWRAPAPPPARPAVALTTIDVPPGWFMRYWDTPAVSPDARHVAFSAVGPGGAVALWLRPLAGHAPRVVAANAQRPFWSVDSHTVGFFAFGRLAKVAVAGGSIQTLAPAPFNGGGTWMSNGDILFTPVQGRGIHKLAGAVGTSEPVTAVDAAAGEVGHGWPSAVPRTDRFTYLVRRRGALETAARLGGLGAGPAIDLGPTDSHVIATASGHLLWVRGGTLIAQSLDVTRTALVGQPTPIAHDVAIRSQMPAHFSAADDVVVFLTRREAMASVHMAVFDRSGAIVSSVGDVAEYSAPRVAPDGGRVAVAQRDPETGTRDIWVHDLNGRPPLRLTFNVHDDTAPVWSADGRAISFTSDRRGERDLYRKDVDGRQPEVLLFASDESKSLNAVSRDGTVLVYDTGARGSVDGEGRFNASDLKAVSVESTPRIYPIATTPAHEDMGDISPDGGLIAYHASENADRVEIFVETFPVKAGRWQVTTNGGSNPIWRADGRELFFLTPDRQVASVDVERSAGAVRFGPIRVLFPVPAQHADVRPFAPFPDGRRFLVLTDVPRPVPQKLSVLVNWRSLLPDQ